MKNILVLLAVFLLLAGCQKEDVILNPQGDQLNKVFIFSGSADGTTTSPFGPNAPFRHFVATGQSTPGGNIELILDYLVTSYTAPNGTSGFGSGELITETGDKIYAINGSGTFTITGTTVTFTATAAIAGGTGEYDNIMGTFTYSGTIDQTTGATHAEWTGTFTHEKPFGGYLTAENQTVTGGSCSPGYVLRRAEGSGKLIHLGKALVSLEHCVNFTNGLIISGDDFMEAANGEKIYVSHNGYTLPIPGISNKYAVTLLGTITGGEGKFEDASGYILVKGTQTMPSGNAECTLEGVIDY